MTARKADIALLGKQSSAPASAPATQEVIAKLDHPGRSITRVVRPTARFGPAVTELAVKGLADGAPSW
jgi:hypothetical protein